MEMWKDVPGYEGHYQVSDQGRVRSLDRVVRHSHGKRRLAVGRVLRPALAGKGYWHVNLSIDNVAVSKLNHLLVLAAFVGPCPAGHEGCHNNGVPTDNRLGNLRYDTPVANNADKKRHGTHLVGPAHHNYKHGRYANV